MARGWFGRFRPYRKVRFDDSGKGRWTENGEFVEERRVKNEREEATVGWRKVE
jgi:hypothetical protein